MADMKKSENAAEKLHVLEETRDGFRIAEEDLKLRGPGEVPGTAQNGMPDSKLGDLVTDVELVREARAPAEKTDFRQKPGSVPKKKRHCFSSLNGLGVIGFG